MQSARLPAVAVLLSLVLLSPMALAQGERGRARPFAPATTPVTGGPLIPVPQLHIQYARDKFTAVVDTADGAFCVVLIATSPVLAHYFDVLPPLLAEGRALASGIALGGRFDIGVPLAGITPVEVYGQALVFHGALLATDVEYAAPVESAGG